VEVAPIINIFNQRLFQIFIERTEKQLNPAHALTEAVRLVETLSNGQVEILFNLLAIPQFEDVLRP
jgi:hypothetical protein